MQVKSELTQGGVAFEEVYFYDLSTYLFDHFNRHQQVQWRWLKENGKWALKHIPSVEEWNHSDIVGLVDSLRFTLGSGGMMLGAFIGPRLVGFAAVDCISFGRYYEYIALSSLHVSYEHRRKGIGKTLFKQACTEAKRMGAKKLYIKATTSQETQAFFKSMKCVESYCTLPEMLMPDPDMKPLECTL